MGKESQRGRRERGESGGGMLIFPSCCYADSRQRLLLLSLAETHSHTGLTDRGIML
jgi:hypothetical protein